VPALALLVPHLAAILPQLALVMPRLAPRVTGTARRNRGGILGERLPQSMLKPNVSCLVKLLKNKGKMFAGQA